MHGLYCPYDFINDWCSAHQIVLSSQSCGAGDRLFSPSIYMIRWTLQQMPDGLSLVREGLMEERGRKRGRVRTIYDDMVEILLNFISISRWMTSKTAMFWIAAGEWARLGFL